MRREIAVTVGRGVELDPLDPIRTVLSDMNRRPDQPPVNGIATGLTVTDPAGWIRADELTSTDALDDLLAVAAARWNAPAHAAAALAWKSYTYWLALPAVVGFAASRRVPLMRPEHVLLRWSVRQPFLVVGLYGVEVAVLPDDPVAATGGNVVSDEAALLAEFRRSIMDEHLEPALRRIQARVHLGAHTLWGSLASGVAYGVSRSAPVIPAAPLTTATRILTALGLQDLVDVSSRPDGGLHIQRRTCCLAFTLPQPKVCAGCCIR